MIELQNNYKSRQPIFQVTKPSFSRNLCFNSADNQQILATFAQENSF